MAKEKTDIPKELRPGFNEKDEPYPGVDPSTGERVTVTLQGLKDEFGPKRGELLFRQIGQVTGTLDGLSPLEGQAAAAGGIHIAGAPKDVQFKVNEILTAKES
jgi:hypothetical protein